MSMVRREAGSVPDEDDNKYTGDFDATSENESHHFWPHYAAKEDQPGGMLMRHLRLIAASIVFAMAGMMFVSPANSQIRIRVNSEHRGRHHYYYHPRHVVYHHRHVFNHHRHEGVRVRLNVR